MPVYIIKCPDCEHQFKGLVMANTQKPKEWFVPSAAAIWPGRSFNTAANTPSKIPMEPAVRAAVALANNKITHNLCYLLKIYID